MKKFFIPFFVIVVAAVIATLLILKPQSTPPPGSVEPGPTATPLPAVKAPTLVTSNARVIPVRSAELSMATSGIVTELPVVEGQQVGMGQLLVKLNAARQLSTVAQAQAELQRAEAQLEQAKAGSRQQDIDAAVASVEAAQARLQRIKQGPKPEEIAAAEATLAAAQAALRKALSGPDQEQIIAAQNELANADAARRQAQAAYDRVAGAPDIGSRPESLRLEQATNDYNAAKARLDALLKGPNPNDVASARAQVEKAQADLNALKAPPSPSDIAAAEAEVRRAQAQLDLLMSGARPEEIRAAEAQVAAAQASLDQAKAALAETELRAPFTGTIALLNVNLGQQVTAGVSIVRLADFTSWQIETDDLTELRIVGISEGDPAVINFDAIPDLELPGQVSRIRMIGENKQGDITYTVIVKPERFDPRLRWNMTAKVTIQPGGGALLARATVTAEPAGPAAPVQVPGAVATSAPAPAMAPTTLPAAAPVSSPSPAAVAAAMTPAPTVAATSTPAPTLPATAAPRPTAQASATSVAALTATPTNTPTVAPSPSPTSLPAPSPTARPVAAAPAPRPTPVQLRASIPILVEPPRNDTRGGTVTFVWQPTGPLPAGAAYEVVWWNQGESPDTARGLAAPTTGTSLAANLDPLYRAGQIKTPGIYWTVLVVQTAPYVRLTQPGASNPQILMYRVPVEAPPPQPPQPTPTPPKD